MDDNKKEFLARFGSAKHIDQILADKHFHSPELVLENPMANEKHHEHLFHEDGPVFNKVKVVRSDRFPQHLRHAAMTHPSHYVRANFASRHDITDDEFHHMKHDAPDVVNALVNEYIGRPAITYDKIEKRTSDIINNGPDSARKAVSEIRGLSSYHVTDVLHSGDRVAIANVAQHNINLNPDHLKTLSEHPDWQIRGRLSMNKNLPSAIREKLAKDENESVRTVAKAYI